MGVQLRRAPRGALGLELCHRDRPGQGRGLDTDTPYQPIMGCGSLTPGEFGPMCQAFPGKAACTVQDHPPEEMRVCAISQPHPQDLGMVVSAP